MRLIFHQLTGIGDRLSNQDFMAHFVTDDYAMFVVADGLGGHLSGEKASRYFCEGVIGCAPRFIADLRSQPETTLARWMDAALDAMIQAFAGDHTANDAHTTCAVLYLDDSQVLTAHCGDTRIYRLDEQGKMWRTKDHSQTQKLLDEGKITERDMGQHPEQHQLTRSLNVLKPYQPEIARHIPPQTGETFLLCTDGFWEQTKPQEFIALAKAGVNREALLKQAQLAYLRAEGRSDNLTVQWVRILEAGGR